MPRRTVSSPLPTSRPGPGPRTTSTTRHPPHGTHHATQRDTTPHNGTSHHADLIDEEEVAGGDVLVVANAEVKAEAGGESDRIADGSAERDWELDPNCKAHVEGPG